MRAWAGGADPIPDRRVAPNVRRAKQKGRFRPKRGFFGKNRPFLPFFWPAFGGANSVSRLQRHGAFDAPNVFLGAERQRSSWENIRFSLVKMRFKRPKRLGEKLRATEKILTENEKNRIFGKLLKFC